MRLDPVPKLVSQVERVTGCRVRIGDYTSSGDAVGLRHGRRNTFNQAPHAWRSEIEHARYYGHF